jgi:hypothetical protein
MAETRIVKPVRSASPPAPAFSIPGRVLDFLVLGATKVAVDAFWLSQTAYEMNSAGTSSVSAVPPEAPLLLDHHRRAVLLPDTLGGGTSAARDFTKMSRTIDMAVLLLL